MKRSLYSIVLILILVSCAEKKIEITPEYIINENWDNRGANSLEIKKMKVKIDSTINPLSDLGQAELLAKLEADSSFYYVANIKIDSGESYRNKKIYFNRDNGFYWWTDHGNLKTKILGKLEKGTWYQISRLSYNYYIIYIDSVDNVHHFVVNSATNY
jgi:hypothetical protein